MDNLVDGFVSMFNTSCLFTTVILVVFMLLISAKNSRLRHVMIQLVMYVSTVVAGGFVFFIILPMDHIPDWLLWVGRIDDILYFIGFLISATFALIAYLTLKDH